MKTTRLCGWVIAGDRPRRFKFNAATPEGSLRHERDKRYPSPQRMGVGTAVSRLKHLSWRFLLSGWLVGNAAHLSIADSGSVAFQLLGTRGAFWVAAADVVAVGQILQEIALGAA